MLNTTSHQVIPQKQQYPHLYKPLKEYDPEIFELIKEESERQITGLEMIASENFTSRSVRECLGSCLTNKYSEGYPGARYYGGNETIDKIEKLCQKRALKAFHLNETEWGCNVQPHSGSPANFAVYLGLLQPHDRIMGLDLPDGGHLTHGYQSAKKKVSSTSMFWESFPYHVDKEGYIDYDQLEKNAIAYHPKLIVAGYSAYPRNLDFKRFREIADKAGSILMCDMAHFSGLVAARETTNPFNYCDIVTTTTHKTLRGPRAGIIFFRKGPKKLLKKGKKVEYYDFENKINGAVFPGLQGGPHENAIAGIAVALKDLCSEEWKDYANQVKKNSKLLGEKLMEKGYKLVSNGTDNHLILVDLNNKGIDGMRAEKVLDVAHITINKNTVPGDLKPMIPGGVRIGTPALTSRGLKENDIILVADFLDRGFKITMDIVNKYPKAGKTMKEFNKILKTVKIPELEQLKKEVVEFAKSFPMP